MYFFLENKVNDFYNNYESLKRFYEEFLEVRKAFIIISENYNQLYYGTPKMISMRENISKSNYLL